jgi:hypothetical protein
VRPSDNSTFILSLLKLTPTGLIKEFVPGRFDVLTMRLDQFSDATKFSRTESMIVCFRQAATKPQLSLATCVPDVNMR